MLAGYDVLTAGAESAEHIIPGHDPEVIKRYPAWSTDEPGIVCLHKPPFAS